MYTSPGNGGGEGGGVPKNGHNYARSAGSIFFECTWVMLYIIIRATYILLLFGGFFEKLLFLKNNKTSGPPETDDRWKHYDNNITMYVSIRRTYIYDRRNLPSIHVVLYILNYVCACVWFIHKNCVDICVCNMCSGHYRKRTRDIVYIYDIYDKGRVYESSEGDEIAPNWRLLQNRLNELLGVRPKSNKTHITISPARPLLFPVAADKLLLLARRASLLRPSQPHPPVGRHFVRGALRWRKENTNDDAPPHPTPLSPVTDALDGTPRVRHYTKTLSIIYIYFSFFRSSFPILRPRIIPRPQTKTTTPRHVVGGVLSCFSFFFWLLIVTPDFVHLRHTLHRTRSYNMAAWGKSDALAIRVRIYSIGTFSNISLYFMITVQR